MRVIRYTRKFFQLSVSEKRLLTEAFFDLIWYGMLIRFFPFRNWQHKIGKKMQPWKAEHLSSEQRRTVADVLRAVNRAGKVLMGYPKCFVISLTLKRILRRRGVDSTLFLGVKKGEPDRLLAHAWLKCGEEVIYGGRESARRYKELVTFT